MITGTVSDATGSVIPGAAVEAKNIATASYIKRAGWKQAIKRYAICLRVPMKIRSVSTLAVTTSP